MKQTPILVMAGGKGSRLGPLTVHRAKPAVPFGGRYRIVDFVLSNILNSGYRRAYVLTQFMAHSLIRHLTRNWQAGSGMFLEVAPAQQRKGEFWYRGTADAVYQNLHLVDELQPDHVGVFGGDHIYKFALDQMEAFHQEHRAALTVAAFPVPRAEAHQFGVLQVDPDWRIVGFQEKPKEPTPIPGRPETCLVSMGNYFFQTDALSEALHDDADDDSSSHDFGKDVIPRLLKGGATVYAYDFGRNRIPGEPEGGQPYWRDVGTIESYYQSNMDLRAPVPALNLYNRDWRIRTAHRHYPPARFVRHGSAGATNDVDDSLVCEGSLVNSATLRRVLVGYDCFIHAGCLIEDTLLLSGSNIGAGARIKRALLDKNCSIEPGSVIGHDEAADRERFPFISPTGIIVLPKGTHVPRQGPIRLACDMADNLSEDPSTREQMARFAGRYVVSQHHRRSHMSAGPRFRRFSGQDPSKSGALPSVDDL